MPKINFYIWALVTCLFMNSMVLPPEYFFFLGANNVYFTRTFQGLDKLNYIITMDVSGDRYFVNASMQNVL